MTVVQQHEDVCTTLRRSLRAWRSALGLGANDVSPEDYYIPYVCVCVCMYIYIMLVGHTDLQSY